MAAEESLDRGLPLLMSSDDEYDQDPWESSLRYPKSPSTVVTDTINGTGATWTIPGWLLRALASALWDQDLKV